MSAPPKRDGKFPTTEWTLVGRLKNADAKVSARALDELCAQYHYPLYCLIRHRGLAHHDAEDALHDFLAKLLRLGAFDDLAAEKGRLRTFLAKALDRFLLNRHRDQARQGRNEPLPDEDRFTLDPAVCRRYERDFAASAESADVIFDRQWGTQLLQRAIERLRQTHEKKGKVDLFEALRPVLASGGSLRGHDTDAIAASLSMAPGTLRAALLRMLREYQALVVEEVRQTVESKDEVEAEIAHLMSTMG